VNFAAVLTGRKHGSHGTHILKFNPVIYKAYKNSAKIIEKFTVRQKGGGQRSHHCPPEYATGNIFQTPKNDKF